MIMIIPMVLSGLGALASTVSNFAMGAKQKKEAKKLENKYKEPKYKIPSALYSSMNRYEDLAADPFREESVLRDRLYSDVSGGIKATEFMTPVERAAAVNSLYGKAMEGEQGIIGQKAQLSRGYREGTAKMLASEFAPREEKRDFEIPYKRYDDAMASASALREASRENIAAGARDVAGIAGTFGSELATDIPNRKAAIPRRAEVETSVRSDPNFTGKTDSEISIEVHNRRKQSRQKYRQSGYGGSGQGNPFADFSEVYTPTDSSGKNSSGYQIGDGSQEDYQGFMDWAEDNGYDLNTEDLYDLKKKYEEANQ